VIPTDEDLRIERDPRRGGRDAASQRRSSIETERMG
jgi:hypothetical protein